MIKICLNSIEKFGNTVKFLFDILFQIFDKFFLASGFQVQASKNVTDTRQIKFVTSHSLLSLKNAAVSGFRSLNSTIFANHKNEQHALPENEK